MSVYECWNSKQKLSKVIEDDPVEDWNMLYKCIFEQDLNALVFGGCYCDGKNLTLS